MYGTVNYYMFRVLKCDDEYKVVRTQRCNGNGNTLSWSRRIVRKDTIPHKLTPVQLCDGKQYSDYGGAVLAVFTRDRDNQKYFGVSVCSTSDRFNFNKGVSLALDRIHEEYNMPDMKEQFDSIVDNILEDKYKIHPVMRTVIE